MTDHSCTAMTQIIGDVRSDKESFAPAPKTDPEDKYISKIYSVIMSSTPCKNIIAQSSSGSGKSTGVVTAMVQGVDPELKNPQAICIVPDKESAIQNMDLLLNVGKHILITSVLGLPLSKADYKPLAKIPPVEAQIIIGTPVTIHNWIVAKKLDIDGIKMFLIDDVDRVLAEPGFKDNVLRIMKDISKRRPQCQAIIYVQTIGIARMLSVRLERNRYKSRTLDGAYTKEQIDKTLEEFQQKQFQVLISTKTLDRGFDPSQVCLVVFYGLSILLGSSSEPDLEQYSHCIGRASQFDRAVVNLMCGDMDKKIMEKIMTLKNVNEVNGDV